MGIVLPGTICEDGTGEEDEPPSHLLIATQKIHRNGNFVKP